MEKRRRSTPNQAKGSSAFSFYKRIAADGENVKELLHISVTVAICFF
jgi:hypothetical protein